MKKRIPSFWAGVLTAVLVLTMTTTALAASGQVSFNFANIALNGETKITAGSTITAANGQQVPGSILYTDAAGGKTNYLPIRAISDLLGVEIGYDSATKTVLLGVQSQTASVAQSTSAVRRWQRTLEDNHIIYTVIADGGTDGGALSSWQLTAVPEDWSLVEVDGFNEDCTWTYRKGKDILTFTCDAANSDISIYLSPVKDAARIYHEATVNGAPADFYQYKDRGVLVWENAAGMLCQLEGPLNQAELENIAATAAEAKISSLPAYQLGWAPEGSTNLSRSALRTAICEEWTGADGVTFKWMCAAAGAGTLAVPDGTPEIVTVNGVQAKYWAGNSDAKGGITISTGTDDSLEKVLEIPAAEQTSTLLWADAATNVTFRIQGVLDRGTLVRIAENVK